MKNYDLEINEIVEKELMSEDSIQCSMSPNRVCQSKRHNGGQETSCGSRDSEGGEGMIHGFNQRNGKVSNEFQK